MGSVCVVANKQTNKQAAAVANNKPQVDGKKERETTGEFASSDI